MHDLTAANGRKAGYDGENAERTALFERVPVDAQDTVGTVRTNVCLLACEAENAGGVTRPAVKLLFKDLGLVRWLLLSSIGVGLLAASGRGRRSAAHVCRSGRTRSRGLQKGAACTDGTGCGNTPTESVSTSGITERVSTRERVSAS